MAKPDKHSDEIGLLRERLAHLEAAEAQCKKDRRALEESEARFRLLANNATDVIWTMDLDMRFTYISPSVVRVRGYTVEEAMVQPLEEQMPGEWVDWIRRRAAEELERDRRFGPDPNRVVTMEIVQYTKWGHLIWIEFTACFLRDEKGAPIGILGLSRDVSERKKLQETLRELMDDLERKVQKRTEDLKQILTLQEAVLESTDDGLIVLDGQGALTLMNARAAILWNLPPELAASRNGEGIGRFMADRLLDSTGLGLLEHAAGEPIPKEPRFLLLKDGRVFEERIFPLRSEEVGAGRVYRYRDVTLHLETERKLRESEERFRMVVEQLPVPMALGDRLGRTLHLNRQFVSAFGWTLEDLSDLSLWWPKAYPDEEYRRHVKTEWNRAVAQSHKDHRDIQPQNWRVTCRGGVQRDIEFHYRSLGDLGLTICFDVTERNESARRLRESEERFRTLFEQSPLSILVFRADGRVLDANRAFEIQWGVSKEMVARWNIQQDPQILALGFEPLIKRVMAGEHVVFPEIQYNAGITGCRGKLSWARTLAYPIHNDDGKLARVIVMIEDVAEKKTAEEQKKNLERQLIQSQKMEAVGALASGVAHDFNNILQGLSGYIRTAGAHARDEGLSRTLREMDRLIERAADLVRDLLTFGHQVKPETKSLDLNEEIRQAVRMLDRTLPKMIHVDTRLAPDLPKVSGDPRQMTQVILNLAANARDAMPTGGELTFETTTLAVAEALPGGIPAGDYVVLKVTDTGQGMDEKLLPHIFTPFFTTKKPGKGTGLGLSTVFGIVKAHGGFMTCESQPDRGTQFAIHLPDRAVETSAAQAAALSASEAPPGQGETILLVDDEEFIRTTAAEFLEDGGYQVITASCGEDALEACRTRPDRPDLVMLDYSMPGMGGRKCLERLVRIYPGIRVLVASGYASRDVETDLIDLGARGFVPKPYRMGELMVVIRRILDD